VTRPGSQPVADRVRKLREPHVKYSDARNEIMRHAVRACPWLGTRRDDTARPI
jgi:hypothetical protein